MSSFLHRVLGPAVPCTLQNTTQLPSGAQTVRLSHGEVCYIYEGSQNRGPLVVLVHGFMGSSACHRFLARHLANVHGRRVLRFDNWGVCLFCELFWYSLSSLAKLTFSTILDSVEGPQCMRWL